LLRIVGMVLAAIVALVWLSGCGGDEQKSPLDGTAWVLGGWNVSSLFAQDFAIRAVFEDGRISGTVAINTYSGPYSADPAGSFLVGAIGRTKKGGSEPAMRAETIYFQLLEDSGRFTLTGGTLTLLDSSGNQLLMFQLDSQANATLDD